MKKRLLISFLFVAVSLFAGSYASYMSGSTQEVHAQNDSQLPGATSVPVKGWLWSDNIGWVSLNCLNTNNCATVSYGVSQLPDGTWAGYGWADTIGWLQFNTGCPAGAEGQCGAKMVNGSLLGWAKFLSAGNGWDGWVSFSNQNDHRFSMAGVQASPYSYGATLSGNNVSGFAWGSDVVGWISFQDVTVQLSGTTLSVKPLENTGTFSASTIGSLPNSITLSPGATSVKLGWFADNANTTYTSCAPTSNATSSWTSATPSPIQVLPSFGQATYSYTSTSGSQTYTLTCQKQGGGTDTAVATVFVASNTPSVLSLKPLSTSSAFSSGSISTLPNSITLPYGSSSVKLGWFADNANTTYTSCAPTSNATSSWTSATPSPIQVLPSFGQATYSYTSTSGSQTYTLTCQKQGGGTDTAVATVSLAQPAACSAVLTGGGTTYCPPGTPGYIDPILSWSSNNSTACSAPWFTGNNTSNNPTSGSQTVTSEGSYTASCTGDSGTCSSNTEQIQFLADDDPVCQTKEICFNNKDDNKNGLTDEGCKRKFKWQEQ